MKQFENEIQPESAQKKWFFLAAELKATAVQIVNPKNWNSVGIKEKAVRGEDMFFIQLYI